MARIAILSLLALSFLASYASAATLREVCDATRDPFYCVIILKATVQANTDFKSVDWRHAAVSRASMRAMMARDGIAKLQNVPKSDEASLKVCEGKLETSVKSTEEAALKFDGKVDVTGNLDAAYADQKACFDALKDASDAVDPLRILIADASKAIVIVKDVIKTN